LLAHVVQVKIHLSGIGVSEFPDFQIDDDQAEQPAMKEQQLDAISLIAHGQTSLPCQEGEVAAQFEEKFLQPVDQRFFQGVF
jgi:hypothetical protein